MSVLVTGGCGFAGHHLVEHLLATTSHDVVVLDSLTYAGRTDRLTDIEGFDPMRVRIMWHDLRAPIPAHPALEDVTAVLHLAAGSHVDRSIADPVPFVANNVLATLNLCEWARGRELTHFVQISTDEVYGPAADGHAHREWEPAIPSNPYAASKAGQEAIAISYWRTYGIPVVITNTMNLYGERQHPEKFIPMLVQRIDAGGWVTLHGRPVKELASQRIWYEPSARHWLHARNHADALCWILDREPARYGDLQPTMIEVTGFGDVDKSFVPGPDGPPVDRPDRWHVAGEERTVLEMAESVGQILHKQPSIQWVDYHSSRPGHDHRYALDSSKIHAAGWKPPLSLDDALERTVHWMVAHPAWLQ
jgi:dTDP-glucose 4,6-dehydratase